MPGESATGMVNKNAEKLSSAISELASPERPRQTIAMTGHFEYVMAHQGRDLSHSSGFGTATGGL